MINIQTYQIPAGAPLIVQGTGSVFKLIAASEGLMITLLRGSQTVAEATGFSAGLKLGPYCPDFTSWQVATLSGLAGNCVVAIGDEQFDYETFAGTVFFTQDGASPIGVGTSSIFDPNYQAQQGQGFSLSTDVPAVAAAYSCLSISGPKLASAWPAPTNFFLKKIRVSNPSAAAMAFDMASGTIQGSSGVQGLGRDGQNQSQFQVLSGSILTIPAAGLIYEHFIVPAGESVEIDLENDPFYLAKGVDQGYTLSSETLDTAFVADFSWIEF